MPAYAASIPCKTFPCTLYKLKSYSITEVYTSVFKALVKNCSLLCEVMDITKDGVHSVKLSQLNNISIIDNLISEGAINRMQPAIEDDDSDYESG